MSSNGEDGDDKKRKTRNQNEKKRRDQFNSLIDELMGLVSRGNEKKMDKALVLQTTIDMLRKHKGFEHRANIDKMNVCRPPFMSAAEYCQLLLEAMDGFVVIVEKNGDISYVSETVSAVLGHDPSFMTGRSIYSFLHPSEHHEVENLMQRFVVSNQSDFMHQRSDAYLDFHCHMSHFSFNPNDTATYEFCKVAGCLKSHAAAVSPDSNEFFLFVLQAVNPILCKDLAFVDENNNKFTSRLSLEWKFLFLDHRASSIIGYFPFEVLGTSGYDFNHFDDLKDLVECHKKLMKYGETTTDYYRFLTKGQQWIWLKTQHYISYNQWNSKPEFVVCTSTVVSYVHVVREKMRLMNLVEQPRVKQRELTDSEFGQVLGFTGCDISEPCEDLWGVDENAPQTGLQVVTSDFNPTVGDIFSDMLEYSTESSVDQDILFMTDYD